MKQNRCDRTAYHGGSKYVRDAALLLGVGLSLAVYPTQAQDSGAKGKSDKPAARLRVKPPPRKKRPGRGAGAAPGQGGMPSRPNGVPPLTIMPLPGMGRAADPAPGAGTKFSFTFHDSNINNVLKLYQTMANVPIVTDGSLTGNVTIINPQPVTLEDAFTILQQVLTMKGYTAIQKKGVISILPFAAAGKTTPLLNPKINDSGETRVDPRDQVMTQVIPVDNVDAEALARELQPLISTGANLIGSAGTNSLVLTDTASNVQRFIALVEALDKTSSNTELRTYPLKRAEASAISDIINNLFKQLSSRGRGGGAPQPGQPGFNPGQPGAPGGGGAPAVLAVPDPRTNSVLVVASPDNQEKIADQIINRLDGDDTNTLDTKTRKIIYANAVEVANLVNTVLSNMHGTGTSSSSNPSFQQRAFFNPFFGGGGNDNSQTTSSSDPLGKVVADPRTNSVFITASSDRMVKIDSLIDSLDKEVPVEATTFVFPLRNALASDVAYALSQAFNTGNQNGFGNFNSFFFGGGGGGGSQGQNGLPPRIQRRLGSSNNSPFGRSVKPNASAPPPPNAPDGGDQGDPNAPADNGGSAQPQGIQGVMTDQGFVPTGGTGANSNGDQKPTRQFFFGGGQRSLGQNGGPQYGRGRTGSYSNLLQLQNNVFVNAAPGGDSLIVTTTPDNYNAVRELIEALDVVPRQVMIEVIIAEVSLNQDQKLGYSLSGLFARLFGKTNTAQAQVNLPTPLSNTGSNGVTLDPTAGGSQFVINGVNYSALLQAVESDNKIKVLATPRVFVANNQEAAVYITQIIPYISGFPANGSIFGNNNTPQVTQQPIGYTLDVTPRITRDGLVTIDVYATASDLVSFQTLGQGALAVTAPIFNQRVTDTEATVLDGETVVVGGLIKDSSTLTVSKIPLLGDIPLIGQFFRSREKVKARTELMIFMTPHVITSSAEARALTLKEGDSVSRQLPDLWKQQPNLDPNPNRHGSLPPKIYYPNGKPPSGKGTGPGSSTGTGTGAGGGQ